MLSFLGYINGIMATGVLAFGIIIGIFFIYKSRVTNEFFLRIPVL